MGTINGFGKGHEYGVELWRKWLWKWYWELRIGCFEYEGLVLILG